MQKGLNPNTTVLAYAYPEDLNFEYGIVVTAAGRVYEYGFDYLLKHISQGTFTEWNDITDSHPSSANRKLIQKALLLAKELKDSTE